MYAYPQDHLAAHYSGGNSVGDQTDCNQSESITCGDVGAEKWQLDLLMQKLRQKSKGTSLLDTAKNVKASLVERRCIVDTAENQRCLDQLQQSIKVNSLQTMVEKLEMVTRQQGLKFTPGTTGNEWFISSDMFYLELLIDTIGVVQEVKIQHDGKAEQQSCPEIVDSLQKHNFHDFRAHLEGLVSIYQLNADKKTKSKVFIALQALESDLFAMASTYGHVTDGEMIVMKSLLGLFQPRKGGHPIKLVFYISPYEFLDTDVKRTVPIDVGSIMEKELGHTATVSVQAYTSQKLQMSSTVTVTRTPDGKSIPRYGVLNATNSTWLQACFSVNLQTPIPICRELLQSIHTTTGINFFDTTEFRPLLNLITKYVSNETLDCTTKDGLCVTLPDQNHCYFMTETDSLEGLMISNVPFTLASQLPQVIATLRQQLSFNTLVASCVRVESKPAPECIIFEINALSHQNLTVSFEHPLEDALVTLEFDLRDVSHPQCHLHAIAVVSDIIPTLEEYACKVVHRTMSIPVTLRAVIRRWQSMRVKVEPPNPNFSLRVGSSFNSKSNMAQGSDLSCGAESERFQQNQQQSSTQQVPGMVMNWNNSTGPIVPNSSFTISPVNPIQGTNFPNQTPMDLVPPYITLSNLQNLSHLNFNPTMVNMLATQISNQQQQGSQKQTSSVLMNILDQVAQRDKRRKRKIPSNESNMGQGSNNLTIPRPSPAPSPKSPRMLSARPSPKRRPSDGSEGSSPRVLTPTTTSMGHVISELGLDSESRWNIDITPVGPAVDNTFSKMLSNLGTDYQSFDDSDIEIESEIPGKFPLKLLKKSRDFPKRSVSLDSSVRDVAGNQGGPTIHTGLYEASGDGFKPLVTPSLSITPVSGGNSSGTVNSILASMRPGIEIIPLLNPVNIPHSITVTPILPKPPGSGEKAKKAPIDEPDGKRSENPTNKKHPNEANRKRKLDEPGSKNMFGSLQLKQISTRPGGMGLLKRSNSAVVTSTRPVLPKGGSLATTAANLSKSISGGKPSVSTLKSVSGSPGSGIPTPPQLHQPQQILSKPKPNREKMKPMMSSMMPMPKMHKIGVSSPVALKSDTPSYGTLVPKLEPLSSLIVSKSEQSNKMEQAKTMQQLLQQQKAGTLIPAGVPQVKKTGLQAVIDKLSKQHSFEEGTKKEIPGKSDLPKGMPSEMSKVKGAGGSISGSPGATTQQGGPGSEYMIKPGAGSQGLKLTINKTKGLLPKDKLKGYGLKGPSGGLPTLKKGLTPSRIPSPKLLAPNSIGNKKMKPESTGGPGGQAKSSPSLMKGSPTGGGVMTKPKSEGEIDLTKKLFMPSGTGGLFDGPKFDTKFQIPKKSRSIASAEKGEDFSLLSKKEGTDGSIISLTEVSPSFHLTPVVEPVDSAADPPTLTVAADDQTSSEKGDEQPPVLSAEIQLDTPVTKAFENDFLSPDSPDPSCHEDYKNKSTPPIPTTPLPTLLEISPPIVSQVEIVEITPSHRRTDDEDQLVMDVPTEIPSVMVKVDTIGKNMAIEEEVMIMPPPRPPPAENNNVPSPVPQVTSVPIPIVSVHILHSPQPNSPALLRSPLVVPSPHSSHPSPYAIDDELMDEALIG